VLFPPSVAVIIWLEPSNVINIAADDEARLRQLHAEDMDMARGHQPASEVAV
jgi:hypothetical protein